MYDDRAEDGGFLGGKVYPDELAARLDEAGWQR
jgi:hypothetical protein